MLGFRDGFGWFVEEFLLYLVRWCLQSVCDLHTSGCAELGTEVRCFRRWLMFSGNESVAAVTMQWESVSER